jgi:hypothetical protein
MYTARLSLTMALILLCTAAWATAQTGSGKPGLAASAAAVPAAPEDGGPRNWEVTGVSRALNLREEPSGTAKILAGYLALRFTALGASRRPRPLLAAAVAWALYALWERTVQVRTPEANIRVDLLLIWPVFAVLSAWDLFRSLR